jgi:2-polyprenyl-3-methyl-5-hydroxy-6-metoxy-1,4-benzoquinol methylase
MMIKRIIGSFRRIGQKPDLEKDAGSYWRMSDREERIQDQSHWRGVMRWNSNRWHDHGEFYLELVLKYLERYADRDYASGLADRTALEWGCGGGSIVRPLCRRFALVYGTDISAASIAECEKQMKSLGLPNFRGIPFPSDAPESVLRSIGAQSVDFIISANVFQHFPSKPYTARILRVMGDLLKPGGFALLQTRYFDGSAKLRQKEENYSRNVIYMTSFAPEEFLLLLEAAGYELLGRERDIEGNSDCHDFYFTRKRWLKGG